MTFVYSSYARYKLCNQFYCRIDDVTSLLIPEGLFRLGGIMLKKEIVDGSLEITDTDTGEIRKIKLATEKQIAFIRDLEKQAGYEPRRYKGLTVWHAKKVIEKLLKVTAQRSLL